jgi:hypothetical protein
VELVLAVGHAEHQHVGDATGEDGLSLLESSAFVLFAKRAAPLD